MTWDVPDSALVRIASDADGSGRQATAELTRRSKDSTDALRAETESLRLQLVASGKEVERLTRWLVGLTIALIVIGVGTLAVAIASLD